MHHSLKSFTEFLKTVDLESYRVAYSPIKTVEMDLDRNVQPLKDIYHIYWDDNNEPNEKIMSFDEFYEYYYSNNKENILAFRKKVRFGEDCDCFDRGLKARIYRTWASLITQIHAGYVAEKLFGFGNVEMSEDLDRKNIDFKITYQGYVFGIQVKKESKRRDARVESLSKKNSDIKIFNLYYFVPNSADFERPYYVRGKKTGQLKPQLLTFVNFNDSGDGILERLDNGFVIFTDDAFSEFYDLISLEKLMSED